MANDILKSTDAGKAVEYLLTKLYPELAKDKEDVDTNARGDGGNGRNRGGSGRKGRGNGNDRGRSRDGRSGGGRRDGGRSGGNRSGGDRDRRSSRSEGYKGRKPDSFRDARNGDYARRRKPKND
mgnify:FL=1